MTTRPLGARLPIFPTETSVAAPARSAAARSARAPWHHRLRVVASVRWRLRRSFFAFLNRAFATDDGKQVLAASLDGLLAPPALTLSPGASSRRQPYPDLPTVAPARSSSVRGAGPLFITARFRTGSTLLWNLFRHVEGHTAYYEPFNERRWFDRSHRGSHTDASHLNVTDYWREYNGLDGLNVLYDEEWVWKHLYMEPAFWNPAMRRFIEILVERAPGRAVLQFNHVDFRLPWLRGSFPEARIVHLYRHPRDQWVSSLFGSRFPLDGDIASFEACDRFYLRSWARDLKYRFPFLDERGVSHPYALFYYIWKLSYLFGVRYSDYSLAFEDLAADPKAELRRLLDAVGGATPVNVTELASLVAPPEIGRWRHYADDAWFRRHEILCEEVLNRFFASTSARARAAYRLRPAAKEMVSLP